MESSSYGSSDIGEIRDELGLALKEVDSKLQLTAQSDFFHQKLSKPLNTLLHENRLIFYKIRFALKKNDWDNLYHLKKELLHKQQSMERILLILRSNFYEYLLLQDILRLSQECVMNMNFLFLNQKRCLVNLEEYNNEKLEHQAQEFIDETETVEEQIRNERHNKHEPVMHPESVHMTPTPVPGLYPKGYFK